MAEPGGPCQGVGAIPNLAWLVKALGPFFALAQILDEVGQCRSRAVLVLRWRRTWIRRLLLCSSTKWEGRGHPSPWGHWQVRGSLKSQPALGPSLCFSGGCKILRCSLLTSRAAQLLAAGPYLELIPMRKTSPGAPSCVPAPLHVRHGGEQPLLVPVEVPCWERGAAGGLFLLQPGLTSSRGWAEGREGGSCLCDCS